MLLKSFLACLICVPAFAQNGDTAALEQQNAELRAVVQHAPKLALDRTPLRIQAPAAGWEIGYPSSVAMDADGLLYVLHRGDKADPVLVVDREGRILRSWGKGMFKIPHSIRIDPEGNIWTMDASSSMIYKFTPQGKKLMEISVGGQPEGKSGFTGTTDMAFAPNGHLFISDGYGNARILEYTADGKRLREWGSAGTGPGQFRQPHGIAVDSEGIVYVADRQNGRLQRFDLTGKYLGEWDNLGMVTTVAVRAGDLWIGTQQRNEPTGATGWLMKIDRRSGKILGHVGSEHGHHVVNVTGRGDLLSGARPDTVLWFRPTP
jgi:DNA-binding beta-propeller fold protein YncE